jgi:hypothetical protein
LIQDVENSKPFHIVFLTLTTDNVTLVSGELIHAPYGLNYTLWLNVSQNTLKGSITTQYWYFEYPLKRMTFLLTYSSYYPTQTCVLDGVYTFEFLTTFGYNYTVSFTLNSQNFCGTVVNATVVGTLDVFADDARELPQTVFLEGDAMYFTVRKDLI